MNRICLLSLSEAEKIPEEYCARWFPKRLERSRRFRFQNDRLRCVGAGALISGVLGVCEEAVSDGPFGKPRTEGMSFSISHSGDYVLLAQADDEVGADIEQIDPKHLELAERVFREDEMQWMRGDPSERFFTLWTMKESVMKALGLGFQMPPESFSVMPILEGGKLVCRGNDLYGDSMKIPGHVISVCTRSPIRIGDPVYVTAKDILE